MNKFFAIIVIALFAAGCGVKAETYVMTKDREGITYKGGNAGYLAGKPQFVEPEQKTRKVYVLELSKPVPEGDVKKIEQEQTVTTTTVAEPETPPAAEAEAPAGPKPIVLPNFDNDQPTTTTAAATTTAGPTESQQYKVTKDDTLQKISKKFYGTYSKWYKIYEANKEKIKNPNFVKPGTELTIPAVK